MDLDLRETSSSDRRVALPDLEVRESGKIEVRLLEQRDEKSFKSQTSRFL